MLRTNTPFDILKNSTRCSVQRLSDFLMAKGHTSPQKYYFYHYKIADQVFITKIVTILCPRVIVLARFEFKK